MENLHRSASKTRLVLAKIFEVSQQRLMVTQLNIFLSLSYMLNHLKKSFMAKPICVSPKLRG
ncbi:hypothetical protein EGI98_12205 [Stenotrophomonas maltophilia]|nr:hypothetical protein EGI98_12205 [Stenotrophomonas maltophilia]